MSTSTTPNKVTLSAGEQAPRFTLTDDHNNTVSLDDYAGKRVIVYFYPRANTPGCTKEACDFRDNLAQLNTAGIDVIAISPDKPEKLAAFRDKYDLTFPLLSDPIRLSCKNGEPSERRKTTGK